MFFRKESTMKMKIEKIKEGYPWQNSRLEPGPEASASPILELKNKAETAIALLGTCGEGRGIISLTTTSGAVSVTGF